MTELEGTETAVDVVQDALCDGGEEQYSVHVTHLGKAERVVDALINAGYPVGPDAPQPLMRGDEIAYVHVCGGGFEYMDADYRKLVGGGCDACDSGSDDPADWRPVLVAPMQDGSA